MEAVYPFLNNIWPERKEDSMSINLTVNLQTVKDRLAYLATCGVASDLQKIMIDPIIADKMLQLNHRNRPHKPNSILTFKRAMMKNEWSLGPDMITFDSKGILSNGQNRLIAIIESGTTQEFVVALGIDPFPDMDCGVKRSAYDLICMENLGDPRTQNKKAVGCIQAMVRRKLKRSKGGTSNNDIVTVYLAWNTALAQMVSVLDTRIGNSWVNAALMAAYLNGVSFSDIEGFKMAYIRETSTNPVDAPALALRQYIRDMAAQGSDQLMTPIYNSTQYALDEYINQCGTNTIPYGIQQPIWEYDVASILDYTQSGVKVTDRYF